MRRVDEPLQRLRAAVAPRAPPRVRAVVPPAPAPREGAPAASARRRRRRGRPGGRAARRARPASARGERPDVQLVEHGAQDARAVARSGPARRRTRRTASGRRPGSARARRAAATRCVGRAAGHRRRVGRRSRCRVRRPATSSCPPAAAVAGAAIGRRRLAARGQDEVDALGVGRPDPEAMHRPSQPSRRSRCQPVPRTGPAARPHGRQTTATAGAMMRRWRREKARPEPAPALWPSCSAAGPDFDLSAADTAATPGFSGGKKAGRAGALADGGERLSDLQERLTAAAKGGCNRVRPARRAGHGHRRQGRHRPARRGCLRPRGRAGHGVQGADRRGARARLPLADPQRAAARRARSGSSTGRTTRTCSIVRVHDLVPRATWARRYATINRFEERWSTSGTAVVKVMLHISLRPSRSAGCASGSTGRTSGGSTTPATSTSARCWPDYQEAYQDAISSARPTPRPGTSCRPTTSGTPAGRCSSCSSTRWRRIDPQWPPADFDVRPREGAARRVLSGSGRAPDAGLSPGRSSATGRSASRSASRWASAARTTGR